MLDRRLSDVPKVELLLHLVIIGRDRTLNLLQILVLLVLLVLLKILLLLKLGLKLLELELLLELLLKARVDHGCWGHLAQIV
jgi:hypothetical protein